MQNVQIESGNNTIYSQNQNNKPSRVRGTRPEGEGKVPHGFYKTRREQKKMLKILINETVSGLLKIIDSNHKAALKLAEGTTSLEAEINTKNPLVYQQLMSLKNVGLKHN